MTEEPKTQSTGGCLLHLLWTLVGPALLLVVAVAIVGNQTSPGAWPDFVLAGLALVIALARLADPTPPATGPAGGTDPASTSRWKFILILTGVVALTLLVAHVLVPKLF